MPSSKLSKLIILFLIFTMVIPWPILAAEPSTDSTGSPQASSGPSGGRLEKLKQIRQERIEAKKSETRGEKNAEKMDLILPQEKSQEGTSEGNQQTKEEGEPPVLDRTFIAGDVNIETDASSGAAVLNYPLTVPPGRNGLTPQLNLNYNSQNSNNHYNFYGFGWDLNLGHIERLNKKGTNKLYTENYFNFSLAGGGGELVNLNPGQTYGFYGNKVEASFNKFEFKTDDSWEVTDTNGTRYLFGKTSASRLDNPVDASQIYRWYLAEIIDTNNNFIKYEYYKNSAQVYPKRINYTGHYDGSTPTDGPFVVNFEPFASGSLSDRPDSTASMAPGFKIETKYRVEKIEVKINSQLRRRYAINFKQSYLTNRSLLSSITETSWNELGQTISLPPTTFDYTNEQAKSEIKDWRTDKWAFPRNGAIILASHAWSGHAIFEPWANLNGQIIDLNNDGYKDLGPLIANPKYKIWDMALRWEIPGTKRFADIDNDGYPDLIQNQNIYLNTGTGFQETTQWSSPEMLSFHTAASTPNNERKDNGVRIIDINGDHYPDILVYNYGPGKDGKLSTTRKSYLNNHSSGWPETSNWQLPADVYFSIYKLVSSHWENTIATYLADVNGDSWPDLVNVYKNDQYITPAVYLNNQSNGWDYNSSWSLPGLDYSLDKIYFTDVNGDGYDDFWYQGKTYLNNRSGQFTYNSNWDTPFIQSNNQPLFADINNDNLPEIFGVGNAAYKAIIGREYYNTGNGWDTEGRQQWELPEYLAFRGSDDNAYRMSDVNGDGFMAILKSETSSTPEERKTWLHDTEDNWIDVSAEWSIPEIFGDTGGNNDGVKITDVNGDNIVDILYSEDSTRKVYLGNTQNGWDLSGWTLPIDFSYPHYLHLRILDINNDRLADIVYSGDSTKEVYFNNGDGTWTHDSSWNIPVEFNDPPNMQRFGDVNGDGLIDILDTSEHDNLAHINNGQNGWHADTSWVVPEEIEFGDHTYYNHELQLTDLNEDGYADIIINDDSYPERNKIYINNKKNGWTHDPDWVLPMKFSQGGDRFIDVNSDGQADFLHSERGEGEYSRPNQTYIKKMESPDLLVSLNTSQGASSQIEYKPSTKYKTIAKSGKSELLNKLPFIIPTVNKIITSDGFTTPKTTTYEYANGYYYTEEQHEQKFAGFGTVTRTDAEGNVSKTYYHQGNETDTALGERDDHIVKRSRAFRQEFYDNTGALEKVAVQKWHNVLRPDGRRFVNLQSRLEVDYAASKAVEARATEYTYDDAGNLDIEENLGEVNLIANWDYSDSASDRIKRNIDYLSNDEKWIKALPEKEQVYNSSEVLEHKKTYYYDDQAKDGRAVPQKGNLTQLDSQLSAKASQISLKLSYDGDYGLVTEEKDPKDNTTTIAYEQTYNLYPQTKTNAEAQTATYTHDLATGQVLTETDPNGNTITKVLDPLGRIKKIKGSNQDGVEVIKQTYTYVDTPLNKSVSVKSYFNATAPNYAETVEYYNGLGQIIQRKTKITDDYDDKYAVIDFTYDSKGQITRQSIPYPSTNRARTTADDNQPHTSFTYDSLGRNLTTTYSSSTVAYTTTFAYDGWATTITDPEGNQKKLYNDAFGNIIQVDEKNEGATYSTYYQYNALQNLTRITDHYGNVRNFTYDTLGRRETAEDLHKDGDLTYGAWNYKYDAASNLEKITDPKSQVINYTYDSLNRVKTEDFAGESGAEVTYTYDTATQGVGRLASVEAPDITISYEYNNQGGIKKETRIINGETYVTSYSYDWQGNPLVITYPDKFQTRYTYNPVGQLNKVEQKKDGGSFTNVIENIDYSPIGQVSYKKYFNGVEENNTYDPNELYRLKAKLSVKGSSSLQDLDYTYDKVGNIKHLIDDSDTGTNKIIDYTYDGLYRLTKADMNGDYTRTYAYDAVGNIENKHGLVFSYNDDYTTSYADPHAVTKIDGQDYTYDKNGNLQADPESRIYEYDYQNRLISLTKDGLTTTYQYDNQRQRIHKETPSRNQSTIYVNRLFEIEKKGYDKHTSRNIYAGSGLAAISKKSEEMLLDLDEDGHFSDTDCDDDDPTRYPGATELCDGIDQACDGLGDEIDIDGDSVMVCAGDCVDTDPTIHPGAEEIPYDGIDNDCDALTLDDDLDQDGYLHTTNCDDSDPLSHPGVIWYLDQDGDDYYSLESPCQRGEGDPELWHAHPIGYEVEWDCDDTDRQEHLGIDWHLDSDDDGYYAEASSCSRGAMSSNEDLVGYWALNEESGLTAYDASGYNNNGTITNATYAEGISGSALEFDGESGYVRVPDDEAIQNIWDGGGSISVWINANSAGGYNGGRILDKNASETGWVIRVDYESEDAMKLIFFKEFGHPDGQWRTTNRDISINTWHHIAIIYNSDSTSNEPIIYIDGVPVGITRIETPTDTSSDNSGEDLYIGNRSAEDRTFDGTIDEVRLYNNILGEKEIDELFQKSAGWYATGHDLEGDCDDTASATYPGADDPCDGIDQACDGLGDEIDIDGDGVMICAGNCDDSDPESYPGMIWYFDQDVDGYYSFESPCQRGEGDPELWHAHPIGYEVEWDCDDTDPQEHLNITWHLDADDYDYYAEKNSCTRGSMASDVDLAGYWTLNEESGLGAFDGSEHDNYGIINNATYVEGISGTALDFDGVGGYVQVTDDSAIQNIFDGGGSISVWIDADSDGEGHGGRIIDKKTGWDIRMQQELEGKMKLLFIQRFSAGGGYDGGWRTTSREVSINTWTHIAVTYDNSSTSNDPILYVNGVSVAFNETETPNGIRIDDSGNDLYIGNLFSDGATFGGTIDEVRLHNDILSEEEINELYQKSAGWYSEGHDLEEDCDDSEPTIHPGADDPCDSIDQACDGLQDEIDIDGDGYMLCEGDCNDDIITVHPGALEICQDDIDQDCNGEDLLMCKCPLPEPQIITPFTEYLCPDDGLPWPFEPGGLITPDEPLSISGEPSFGIASVDGPSASPPQRLDVSSPTRQVRGLRSGSSRDQEIERSDDKQTETPRVKTTIATYYYHTDHLGGTSVVTDENGEVVQVLDYYPYGGTRIDEQTDFDSESKYTGQKLDAESGIYYYNARYYDQEIGRFLSQDPAAFNAPEKFLADPQQLNLYAYTRNNPVVLNDPEGENAALGGFLGLIAGSIGGTAAAGIDYKNMAVALWHGDISAAGDAAAQALEKQALGAVTGFIVGATLGASVDLARGLAASSPKVQVAQQNLSWTINSAGNRLSFSSSSNLRYTQTSASYKFSTAKDTPSLFKGRPIENLVSDLKTGAIKPAAIPVRYIERDGLRMIIDTRSSITLQKAGIDSSNWNWKNVSTDQGIISQINQRLTDNKLPITGTTDIKITGS